MEMQFDVEELKKLVVEGAVQRLLQNDWEFHSDVTESMNNRVREGIKEFLVKMHGERVDEVLREGIDKAMSANLVETDMWGSPRHKNGTTWNERLEKKAVEYMHEKVDEKGRTSRHNSYGEMKTRVEWAVHRKVAHLLDEAIKKEFDKIRDTIADDVASEVAKAVKTKIKRSI